MSKPQTLRLILGDQLNEKHSWFKRPDKEAVFVLMEIRQETDYATHHIQKFAAFFAAMRAFSGQLRGMGHRVLYLKVDDPKNRQTIAGNIKELLKKEKFNRLEYQLPDEYWLDVQLAELAKALPVPCHAADTEHFFTGRQDVKNLFVGKKRYLMESFYRGMRKRLNILMDHGNPVGGQWNFDQQNRRAYDQQVPIPEALVFDNDVSDIVRSVRGQKIATPGEIEPARLTWPITRGQS